jgi:protocatechuate 3,4-dioxygenase beta subunit
VKQSTIWSTLALAGALIAAVWFLQEDSEKPANSAATETSTNAPASDDVGAHKEHTKENEASAGAGMRETATSDASGHQGAELTREEIANPGVIQLLTPSGAPADGRIVLVHDREELRAGIARATDIGESLWENISDVDGQTSHGELVIDLSALHPNKETLALVFAPGFAPAIQSLGTRHSFPIQLQLTPVAPIKVVVEDPTGNPIAGAVVAVRSAYDGSANAELPLTDQLQWMFFQSVLYSDENGEALFSTVLQGGNNVIVQPKNGLASSSKDNAAPGTTVTMVCDVAFQVHGRVLDAEGKPIQGARVKAYSDLIGDVVFVNDDTVGDDGSFSIDRIPASQPAIQLIAIKEGYESSPWTLPNPTPEANYTHDFELHPAVAGTVQLVTNSGAPIAGAYITFFRTNADYVPGYYFTDEQGRADLQPVFRKDFPYTVKVELGNNEIPLETPFFAGDDSTITIPGLSRFASWNVDESVLQNRQLEYCVWSPNDSSKPGYFWWEASGKFPWVPSGRGTFAARFSDKSCLEQTVDLQEGEELHVSFSAPSTSLSLFIPKESSATVLLFSQSKNNLFQAREVNGPITIPCDPGIYELRVLFSSQPTISMTGIRVPPEGLDLGEIEVRANAGLTIRVLDSTGRPLPDSFVSVVPPSGFEATSTWTNEDGEAQFQELVSGPFFVYCSCEDAYLLAGREALTSIQLLPGQHQELTLKMGSAEGTVEVAVDRTGLPMPQGFFVGGGHRVNYHLPSDGVASLPASEESGYVGVTANRTGYAMIAALQIPAGPGSYRIERGGLSKITLHFVDESGSPQSGLMIGFYLAGQHLPYRPHTDANGIMELELQPALPIELEVWTRTGSPLRFPISNLTSGLNVVIPKDLVRKNISFHNESGARIQGLQVVGAGFPECLFAKSDGTVDVPVVLRRHYQAQALNYFPVLFDPNVVSEVTMPRSLDSPTFLGAPEGTRFVYLQAHAAFDSPLALEGWLDKREDGKWQASSLPVGKVTVTAYGHNDRVLGEYQLTLSPQQNEYSLAR